MAVGDALDRAASPASRAAMDPRPAAARAGGALQVLLCTLLFSAVAWLFVVVELRRGARSPSAPMAGDLLSHYHITMQHAFAWLRAGTLPLWDPHQLCGAPFAAASHQGFVYPFYLPYLLLDAALAFEVHLVLHLVLACLGVTLLCRHFGLGWIAAGLAGLIYGYQGSVMIKVFFPDFLASAAWIPWTFLAVDLVLCAPSARRCAGLAVVLGMSILGGHGAQFVYFTAWALLPLVLVRSWQLWRQGGAAALGRAHLVLAAGGALGILLAMVRILPFAELLAESWRPPGNFSQELLNTVHVPPGDFAESLFSPEPPPIPRWAFSSVDTWRQAYAGTVPLLLAGLGLLLWRRRGIALAMAVAGGGAAVYAFGMQGFVYPLIFELPGGNWFRGIDRGLVVFGLAVAVLAGAGLDRLAGGGAGASTPMRPAMAAGWAAAAAALLVGLGVIVGQAAGRMRLVAYALGGAALLGAGAAAGARRLPRALALGALAVLVTADLFHAQRFAGAVPSALGGYYARHADVFAAIRQRQNHARTYIWSDSGWGQPLFFYSDIAKAGLVHGLYLPTDYEPLVGQRIADLMGALGKPVPLPIGPIGYVPFEPSAANLPLLELLGVRFFVVDDATEARLQREYPGFFSRLQPILQRGGISLYEYPGAMPRAFLAQHVAVVPADQTLARMREADLRTHAFVEDAHFPGLPPDAATAPGRVELVGYEPNRVEVETDSPAHGLLVLTDQYYPGWRASVDGEPTPLYRTDYAFRGVLVPAGRHRVAFTYRPLSWLLGAAGSALGLVITVMLVMRGKA
jgi:hypothetical protein